MEKILGGVLHQGDKLPEPAGPLERPPDPDELLAAGQPGGVKYQSREVLDRLPGACASVMLN
jgi:hypothetical protein